MSKKTYIYPNIKHLSIRIPKKLFNQLNREATQSHMKVSKYVRRLLINRKNASFDPNKVDSENSFINQKLDDIKNFPWREAENLNQIARKINSKEIPKNLAQSITAARNEAERVENTLESLKR